MYITIDEIRKLREKEDRVEFKEAKSDYSITGGSKTDYRERRKCVLGYVVALANEGGGRLIFGVKEGHPENTIVGSQFALGREGELEQTIYRDKKIRVTGQELFDEHGKRVLVINIPSRPVGKVYTFEDIPLMRVGDQLERMSDEEYFKIVQEQEPDFSATICQGLTIGDLDEKAIETMKRAYARKQNNSQFLTLSNEQTLKDLDLLRDSNLTYAALILLGKEEIIKKYLPQAAIHLEYRGKLGQITFDKRDRFAGAYFIVLEQLWNAIDARNGVFPVQQGPYIFDISFFNKEVIREAINNAVAHRDYRITGEILIKQYPSQLSICSPGGFPKGVTLENLLTVNSTPRNRLLAEILAKTGIVERSGQGVDKIYYQCLSEAKGEPDYSNSDDFQVDLCLPGIVQDKAFALFISYIQNERGEEQKLSVHEIITLEKIRKGLPSTLIDKQIVEKLIKEGLVDKRGKTRNTHYNLSRLYYEFINKKGEYSANESTDRLAGMMIMQHMQNFKEAQMSDFVQLLNRYYSKEQIKYLIYKLSDTGILQKRGKGSGTKYFLGEQVAQSQQMIARAIQLGIEEMVKRGEIEDTSVTEGNSTNER